MKKVLIVSLLAVAALVSQSWAQGSCAGNAAGTTSYCLYNNTELGCWPATPDACFDAYGWLFCGPATGVEGEGGCKGGAAYSNAPNKNGSTTPPTVAPTAKGCCKWAEKNQCNTMTTDLEVTNCGTGDNKIMSQPAACPKDAQNHDTCPSGDGGDGGNGGNGGNGGAPILQINPNMGLIVATHGRALHISSDRNATVTLYTLGGQKVLSGTVSAGNKVFSLMSQNPGVYYAVVQSGSYTQTVNVVLK